MTHIVTDDNHYSGIHSDIRQFGRGFGRRNLAQMRAFYLAWPTDRILQALVIRHSRESGNPVIRTDGSKDG